MNYRSAFIEAAHRQPWWQWIGIALFNLFNLSAADYFRLWRGLGTTAKDILWTAAVALTALLMYKTGGDAWREVQRQKTELEVLLRPRLQVVFDPERYQACLHESVWPADAMIDRTFRVALVNLSDGETVDDVEVLLAELVGVDRLQDTRFLPVPLARMTSSPLLGEEFKSFRLHPGKTPTFVEVAIQAEHGR